MNTLLPKLPKSFLRFFEYLIDRLQHLKDTITPAPLLAFEHVTGFWLSQSISTAVSLGIFESLRAGPKSSGALAAATSVNEVFLQRLLRLLTRKRVIRRVGDTYALNRVSKLLVKDSAGSFASLAKLNQVAAQYRAWGALAAAVRLGEAAFTIANDKEFFTSFAADQLLSDTFNNAMEEMSALSNPFLDKALPLPAQGLIIDLGGGSGVNLVGLLRSRPLLRGIAFDMPTLTYQAQAVIDAAGLNERCSFVAGSFFESIPPSGDVYILKAVLHDWSDSHCKMILQQIRAQIPNNGRVLIIEMLVGESLSPFTELMDMQMMVLTDGGYERTKGEFESLLSACKFKLAKVYPSGGPQFVLEAYPF